LLPCILKGGFRHARIHFDLPARRHICLLVSIRAGRAAKAGHDDTTDHHRRPSGRPGSHDHHDDPVTLRPQRPRDRAGAALLRCCLGRRLQLRGVINEVVVPVRRRSRCNPWRLCGTSVWEGDSGWTKGWTGQRGDVRRRSEQPTGKPIGPLRPALQRWCSQEIGSRGHPLSRNRRTS
jgi:hypothetical protein